MRDKPMIHERENTRTRPFLRRDRDRDRMPGHEDEIAIGKNLIEEPGYQDVHGSLFDKNGLFEIPVFIPFSPELAFVFLAEKPGRLGQVSRRIKREAAGSAKADGGRINRLKELAFVLTDPGVGERAHIRMLRENPRDKRRAAPRQPAYEYVTRSVHRFEFGRKKLNGQLGAMLSIFTANATCPRRGRIAIVLPYWANGEDNHRPTRIRSSIKLDEQHGRQEILRFDAGAVGLNGSDGCAAGIFGHRAAQQTDRLPRQ